MELARYMSNGQLDPSFGQLGRALLELDHPGSLRKILIQPDGKILALGSSVLSSEQPLYSSLVARFEATGAPDTSFGDNGVSVMHFWHPLFLAKNMVLQPDGKIVVGADTGGWDGSSAALVRLNPDGAVDATYTNEFPGDGYPLELRLPEGFFLVGLSAQDPGRIVVIGWEPPSTDRQAGSLVFLRLRADGSIESTVRSAGGAVTGERENVSDVAVQVDGRIDVLSTPGIGSSFGPKFVLTRLTADGDPDPSFGQAGHVIVAVGDAQNLAANGVAVGPGGALTVVGWASAGPGGYQWVPSRIFVAQFDVAGSLDSRFGTQGIATYVVGNQPGATAEDAVVQADGKPVVIGSYHDPVADRDRSFVLRLQGPCAARTTPRCPQPRAALVSFSSLKVLDVAGNSRTAGTGVIQWSWTGGGNQQWRLEPVGNGAYRIVSVVTGMVLDVGGASKLDGAGVIQWPWTGALNQQWAVYSFPANQNVLVFVSMNSGLVLETDGGSAADGARITQGSFRGGLNQVWYRAVF